MNKFKQYLSFFFILVVFLAQASPAYAGNYGVYTYDIPSEPYAPVKDVVVNDFGLLNDSTTYLTIIYSSRDNCFYSVRSWYKDNFTFTLSAVDGVNCLTVNYSSGGSARGSICKCEPGSNTWTFVKAAFSFSNYKICQATSTYPISFVTVYSQIGDPSVTISGPPNVPMFVDKNYALCCGDIATYTAGINSETNKAVFYSNLINPYTLEFNPNIAEGEVDDDVDSDIAFKALSLKVANLENNIESLSVRVASLEDDVNTLKSGISEIKSTLSEFKASAISKLESIDTYLSDIKSLITTQNSTINSINTSITTIKNLLIAVDFATETTLKSVNSKLASVVTLLTDIKAALHYEIPPVASVSELVYWTAGLIEDKFNLLYEQLDNSFDKLYNVIMYGTTSEEEANQTKLQLEEFSTNANGLTTNLDATSSYITSAGDDAADYISVFSTFFNGSLALQGISAVIELGLVIIFVKKLIGR